MEDAFRTKARVGNSRLTGNVVSPCDLQSLWGIWKVKSQPLSKMVKLNTPERGSKSTAGWMNPPQLSE